MAVSDPELVPGREMCTAQSEGQRVDRWRGHGVQALRGGDAEESMALKPDH